MSIVRYADHEQAAGLVGIDSTLISVAWMKDADDMIHTLLGFKIGSYIITDEYYDVRDYRQKSLILKNYPIISIQSITDNAQASSPTTVLLTDILIKKSTGEIILKQAGNTSGTVYCFTKGDQAVKASYTWGWTEVPDPIAWLATLWVARLAQQWQFEQEFVEDNIPSGGIKQFKLGQFSVTVDTAAADALGGMQTKFDTMILKSIEEVKAAYARNLHIASTSAIGVFDTSTPNISLG